MADEPTIEQQDTPNEIEELQKRMEDIEMSLGVFNPRNLAGLRTKDLQQATRANLFGDGSDGDVVVSTEINLTRDMFYNSLTVEAAGIINTKSFRIFVKDQFIKKPGGVLKNNGNDGGDGVPSYNMIKSLGGNGGAAVASGSLSGGLAGGKGADTESVIGSPGDAGAVASKSLGSAGSGGGGGGAGSYAGGAGGAGGSQTGTLYNIIKSFFSAYYLIDILPTVIALTISAGSGGGGSGGSDSLATYGGGGGGAGGTGAMIWIAANRMFIEGTSEIQCNGGNGGDGADARYYSGSANEGGGGGGAGGSGGVIILIYGEKTGTGTLQVAAGSGGAGGTGVVNNGAAGSGGAVGKTYNIQIS